MEALKLALRAIEEAESAHAALGKEIASLRRSVQTLDRTAKGIDDSRFHDVIVEKLNEIATDARDARDRVNGARRSARAAVGE